MITGRNLRRALATAGVVLLSSLSNTTKAEEEINKSGAKFLGWVISDSKFRTCSGTEIDRRHAKVRPTTRRCSRDKRLLENLRRERDGYNLPPLYINESPIRKPRIHNITNLELNQSGHLRYDFTRLKTNTLGRRDYLSIRGRMSNNRMNRPARRRGLRTTTRTSP